MFSDKSEKLNCLLKNPRIYKWLANKSAHIWGSTWVCDHFGVSMMNTSPHHNVGTWTRGTAKTDHGTLTSGPNVNAVLAIVMDFRRRQALPLDQEGSAGTHIWRQTSSSPSTHWLTIPPNIQFWFHEALRRVQALSSRGHTLNITPPNIEKPLHCLSRKCRNNI